LYRSRTKEKRKRRKEKGIKKRDKGSLIMIKKKRQIKSDKK